MHNYKADYYNPLTLERTQIETEIPVNLVKGLKEALDGLEDYNITPTMVNPEYVNDNETYNVYKRIEEGKWEIFHRNQWRTVTNNITSLDQLFSQFYKN